VGFEEYAEAPLSCAASMPVELTMFLSRWMPVLALQAAAVLCVASPARAADAAASQASGVVAKTESSVKRGARAAERGIVTAASATERGAKAAAAAVERGASAAARGVTAAGSAVERTFKRLGLPGESASAPR
jgi:hypothetical protein